VTCSLRPGRQLEPGQAAAELAAAPAPRAPRRAGRPSESIASARHRQGADGSTDAPDRLLDVHAAAAVLSVAPRTLYKWVAQGRLPVVHLGRAVRFRESALWALVRDHEEPAAAPLAGALTSRFGAGTDSAPNIRP
jgi:excisionase family DNA binding protein